LADKLEKDRAGSEILISTALLTEGHMKIEFVKSAVRIGIVLVLVFLVDGVSDGCLSLININIRG
jgi:hypothetical protein